MTFLANWTCPGLGLGPKFAGKTASPYQPSNPLFSCYVHMGKTALYFTIKGHVTDLAKTAKVWPAGGGLVRIKMETWLGKNVSRICSAPIAYHRPA